MLKTGVNDNDCWKLGQPVLEEGSEQCSTSAAQRVTAQYQSIPLVLSHRGSQRFSQLLEQFFRCPGISQVVVRGK